MITKRDRKIINHIGTYGFITIEQTAELFYSSCKTKYSCARRELSKILNNGNYIRVFRNLETNTNVYVPKESRLNKIRAHNIGVMDVYCKLVSSGYKIIKFDREVNLENKKDSPRVDAEIEFEYAGKTFKYYLEYQKNYTPVLISKFKAKVIKEKIYDENIGILIVQDTKREYKKLAEDLGINYMKIVTIPLSLSGLEVLAIR